MSWMIGRAAAMSQPRGGALQGARETAGAERARRSRNRVVVPILIDALLMVESYRGARHQISFLPELTESVDALLRDLTIVEKTKEWAGS